MDVREVFVTSRSCTFLTALALIFSVDPSLMIVTWVTLNPINESIVEYGESDVLDQRANGSISVFQDGGSEKRVEYVHRVVLRNLRPGQRYCRNRARSIRQRPYSFPCSLPLW